MGIGLYTRLFTNEGVSCNLLLTRAQEDSLVKATLAREGSISSSQATAATQSVGTRWPSRHHDSEHRLLTPLHPCFSPSHSYLKLPAVNPQDNPRHGTIPSQLLMPYPRVEAV